MYIWPFDAALNDLARVKSWLGIDTTMLAVISDIYCAPGAAKPHKLKLAQRCIKVGYNWLKKWMIYGTRLAELCILNFRNLCWCRLIHLALQTSNPERMS